VFTLVENADPRGVSRLDGPKPAVPQ